MERAILNNFSTTTIIVLFVGGMVLVAIVGVLLARRFFPDLAEGRFADVVEGLRVVFELIFALILAFVIAAVLRTLGDAEATVATEATHIAQLERENGAFDEDDERRLNAALGDYVHALVDDEWETMKRGEESPVATAALEAVYVEYRNLTPRSDVQKATFSLALSKLDDIASERRNRLNIAAAELPTMLRVLVAIGIVLLLLLEYRPQLSLGASLAFMGGLAAIVTSAYLLTLVLNYPFASDISVSNDPLKRDRLATFWDEELAYRRQDGDTPVRSGAERSAGHLELQRIRNARPALLHARRRARPGRARRSSRVPAERRLVRRLPATTTVSFPGGWTPHGVFRGWWYEEPRRIEDEKAATGGRVRRKVVNGGALAWRGVRRSGQDAHRRLLDLRSSRAQRPLQGLRRPSGLGSRAPRHGRAGGRRGQSRAGGA